MNELLLPDPNIFSDIEVATTVTGIMNAAFPLARGEEVRAETDGLGIIFARAFVDETYTEEQAATFGRMLSGAMALGTAVSVIEDERFRPPSNGIHPAIHAALAMLSLDLPEEVWSQELRPVGGYCIRVGHFVGRTGGPGRDALLASL